MSTSPRYRANSPRRIHAQTGALSNTSNSARLVPMAPVGKLRTNMSPRWHPPELSPRLAPSEVAAAVHSSRYIRDKPVVPPEWQQITTPWKEPVPPAPIIRRPALMPGMESGPASPKSAASPEPASEQDEAAQPEYSTTEEEEEDDEMDDNFDEEMLMIQRQRGRGGAGGANRRMSLADMSSGEMLAGMAKLRESLSEVEVDEYRDFFDLVDADGSNRFGHQTSARVRVS